MGAGLESNCDELAYFDECRMRWLKTLISSEDQRRGGLTVLALFALNAVALSVAWFLFRAKPIILASGLVAYALGLRHAFDADHIAAIDNATRKLLDQDKRPLLLGLYFALGHSTIVIGFCALLLATGGTFRSYLEWIERVGGEAGTIISAGLLFMLASANIVILFRLLRRSAAQDDASAFSHTTLFVSRGGLTSRLVRRLYRGLSKSWHMYLMGLLFGLGFDTASQIGLLGLSVWSSDETVWALVMFPLLFLLAMSLVDTTDGILMMFAYRWALDDPQRKRVFNITVMAVSIAAALCIGTLEVVSAIPGTTMFVKLSAQLSENLSTVGVFIAILLLGSWALAFLAHRWRQHKTETKTLLNGQ